jgi:hypothetical protein
MGMRVHSGLGALVGIAGDTPSWRTKARRPRQNSQIGSVRRGRMARKLETLGRRLWCPMMHQAAAR